MLRKIHPIRDGVTFLPLARSTKVELPLYMCRLRAGFPSLADDYLEGKIDLNTYLAAHPAATSLYASTVCLPILRI
jgi:hypothetical protein